MNRAVDPFEEFLRKKKVEMLEDKVRQDVDGGGAPEPEPAADTDDGWAPPAPRNATPESDQHLEQEMAEFFERGAGAGAELFAHAEKIDEEQVDDIKDALEDVFDAEQAGPEVVAEDDDTFIDFFKEVQTSFDPDLAELRKEQQELAREVVQPPEEGTFEDEPLTAEFPPPEELAAEAAAAAAEVEPEPMPEPMAELRAEPMADPIADPMAELMSEPMTELEPEPMPEPVAEFEPEPEPMPVEAKMPFAPDPLQLEAEEELVLADAALDTVAEPESPSEPTRLELSEILAPMGESDDLRERVEVLSRLVIKLVERSELSESEIIEVLIKSGVGF